MAPILSTASPAAAASFAPGDFVQAGPTTGRPTSTQSLGVEEQLAEHLPVELQPTFTEQDEQTERISMSIEDIYKVQSDLTGVTLDMAGLSLGTTTNATNNTSCNNIHNSRAAGLGGTSGGGGWNAGERPDAMVDALNHDMALLRRLDDELARLPAHQTVVYREARTHHPHLTTDELKMHFLDCEDGDAVLAAARLARHWEARLDVFGSDRCFLPLTAEGAMRGQIEPMIRQGIDTVLPVTDATGRAIILVDGSKRNFDVYSFIQEIQAMFYLVQCLAENDEIRKRGVVFLMDGRNMQRSHYSRKISLLSQVIFHCMPVRCRAFHVFPNWLVHHVLAPVIKRMIPKELRMRLKFHYGTADATLRELEGFNLPRSRLPVQLGGDVLADMDQWVAERIALEAVKSANVAPSSDVTLPPAKKARGMSEGTHTSTKIGSKEPFSKPTKVGSTPKSAGTKKKRRGRRFGRNSDPRMARAIEIKASNEAMSLEDALVAGGYVFHYDSEILDKVDEDGISLTQRKNNLCRRMRQRREQKNKGDAK